MIIRVLPELENRSQWLAFMRREQPYCLIEQPECLVDFQTHFLQLTLFSQDHRDPERYTLGSRASMKPAWDLIKGCNWSLRRIIEGLEQLEFDANVRDNALLGVHGDVSVRKRRAREPNLIAPSQSGLLTPLRELPDNWTVASLSKLLANAQYRDWNDECNPPLLSPRTLLIALRDSAEHWQVARDGGRLFVLYKGEPLASFTPNLEPPPPRLRESEQPAL
ncbi:hypothetical protein [Marinobacterium litorale]|jgi:hypothetical protein|uniref:hypothetical protein n=1 Tax=Marinobacterium litorale TaxID=404770 RepID=UPI00041ED4DF|nr:hypothetical protein [Marinobacterium litorale]